jgi:RNA polymerase subunit RPABC4/transcription elongation factor Spt4
MQTIKTTCILIDSKDICHMIVCGECPVLDDQGESCRITLNELIRKEGLTIIIEPEKSGMKRRNEEWND